MIILDTFANLKKDQEVMISTKIYFLSTKITLGMHRQYLLND